MADGGLSFCMVTTFYPPYHFGGEATSIYYLSNELAERGHRVTVVHCVDAFETLTSAPPRGAFPHHENVTVYPLRSRFGSLSPLTTYLTGRPGLKSPSLDKIFAGEPFDVVHFHIITLVGGPGVLHYGADAVSLYTLHDHWLVCPMYDLWKNNRELCEKPTCFRCSLRFRRPPQLWRYTDLLRRELSHVDLFLAPSLSVIEQHRRRGFNYPMRHLPNFLPLDRASREDAQDAGAPSGRPYFLFVGRLVKLKGVQTLVDTFRTYDKADLLIAGDGDYEGELRRSAADLSHVRFLGRVHPDALKSLYARAIAVIVPSLAYETFGVIALEAFAQRTPVVARELGAPAELVHESGGGFTYRSPEELLDAMEAVRLDPELRSALGGRGHAAFVERWSEGPHVARYLQLVGYARAAKSATRSEPEPALR